MELLKLNHLTSLRILCTVKIVRTVPSRGTEIVAKAF